jgi:surfeit locus 1 family protein
MQRILKHGKLNLIALLFICAFCRLGFWQLDRAQEKITLATQMTTRMQALPLSANDIQRQQDLRFHRVHLEGQFDNAHTILLDNKTQQGQIGYEIYTPFKADHLATALLVDRGFIVAPLTRDQLPVILPSKEKTVAGILNLPPAYVAWGAMTESSSRFPLRVEFIDLPLLAQQLKMPLAHYVVEMNPTTAPNSLFSPQKHWSYAVQWFAFALTLLILSIVLNLRSSA